MAISEDELPVGLGPDRFTHVVLVKGDWEKDQHRYCYLLWQETLFGEGALVHAWGRRGTDMRREKAELFASPKEGWPQVRRLILRARRERR